MPYNRQFPLVADGEPLFGERPVMALYEETDLISNIKGPYQERDFSQTKSEQTTWEQADSRVEEMQPELLPPLFEARPSAFSRRERQLQQKTQGQLAREAAREDVKRKRSAAYLVDDKPHLSQTILKKAKPAQDPVSSLPQLADRLRQDTYILAELPQVYALDKPSREQASNQPKNSYDFLKKSQVYNYPERQKDREYQMAQELNLRVMEEE